MLRLLPLLAFALLPAAIAAPVPAPALAPARPEFGANGLLTEADLEKVAFDSRPVKDEDRVLEKDVEDVVQRVRRAKEDEKEKERPENRFDVAVHIPRATFREGGPAPAYFVLRNNRGHELGLRSRLDLCPEPRLYGGSMTFDIRDRDTGSSVPLRHSSCTHCGGGSLVDVPADGYYCLKVDMNHLAGHVLPPGKYEVDWGYRQFRSAPVSFTVIERDKGKPAPLAKRPALRFFHLREGDDDGLVQLQAEREDRAIFWAGSNLEWVRANSLAAALAVGQVGVFVPDIYDIPTKDKLIEARAEWKPYREGDRLMITLSSAVAGKAVEFNELPQLYLQLETPAESEADDRLLEQSKQDAKDSLQLRTPLTVEVCLPNDWRSRVGPNGPARVSVLVISKEIELPRGGEQIKKLEKLQKLRDEGEVPVWSGVVRTAPTALHLPLPMFPKQVR